jgi:hypothetical protein
MTSRRETSRDSMPPAAARSRQSEHNSGERRDPLNGHPEMPATRVPSRTLLYLNQRLPMANCRDRKGPGICLIYTNPPRVVVV